MNNRRRIENACVGAGLEIEWLEFNPAPAEPDGFGPGVWELTARNSERHVFVGAADEIIAQIENEFAEPAAQQEPTP